MLVTMCLSTIAGIAFAVHRLNSGRSQSNHGDRRVLRMTASEVLTVAAILIAGCLAAGLYFTNGNVGGIRIEVTAPGDIGSLGPHPLTIVDTSGKKPLGGTTSTHRDDASGITTHFFKSANGRYNITLVDEVLTVNGERYTLENPTDAIRIVDDRVEITQVAALPRDADADTRKAGQPLVSVVGSGDGAARTATLHSSREIGRLNRSPKAETNLPPRTALVVSCSRSRGTRLSSRKGRQTVRSPRSIRGGLRLTSHRSPRRLTSLAAPNSVVASTS